MQRDHLSSLHHGVDPSVELHTLLQPSCLGPGPGAPARAPLNLGSRPLRQLRQLTDPDYLYVGGPVEVATQTIYLYPNLPKA